jgi:hypothetical protein
MQQTASVSTDRRPLALTAAAVLCVLNSLVALATLLAPGIPAPVVAAGVVVAIIGLAGAYGVWQLRRWGAIVSLVVLAINALLAAPGIPFAPNLGMHAVAGATVIIDLAAIALLVVPASRRAYS